MSITSTQVYARFPETQTAQGAMIDAIVDEANLAVGTAWGNGQTAGAFAYVYWRLAGSDFGKVAGWSEPAARLAYERLRASWVVGVAT